MTSREPLYISQYFQWQDNKVMLNGAVLFELDALTPPDACADLYKKAGLSYPKFFKMDLLSKAAYLGAAMVLPENIQEDRTKIATVLSSRSGCIDVDKKFEASRAAIASPALFVYTLPNIMLGEICIANGFKGEQMCTLSDEADGSWLEWHVSDLIRNRDTQAALCGHAEATEAGITVAMMWVTRLRSTAPFHIQNIEAILKSNE